MYSVHLFRPGQPLQLLSAENTEIFFLAFLFVSGAKLGYLQVRLETESTLNLSRRTRNGAWLNLRVYIAGLRA